MGKPLTPEHKAKISATLKGHIVTQETRRLISENTKAAMARPEVKEQIKNGNKERSNAPEYKILRKEIAIKIWERPGYRKHQSEMHTGHIVSPETIEKVRQIHLGSHWSEDRKSRMSKKMHDLFCDGKHPNVGKPRSEATRKKLSESHKGERNPMWKGGYTPLRYCFKFNKQLKDSIRAEHKYTCFLCRIEQTKPGLGIHHIDYNHNAGCKNKRFALLPLCSTCHGKTNYNRWYWFNLLINYWAMNKDIKFGGEEHFIFPYNMAGTFDD